MTTQKTAKLRVCASCEWIFNDLTDCPKCGFGSYGARYVYGDAAYRHAKSQKPWKEKKLSDYSYRLHLEVKDSQCNMR